VKCQEQWRRIGTGEVAKKGSHRVGAIAPPKASDRGASKGPTRRSQLEGPLGSVGPGEGGPVSGISEGEMAAATEVCVATRAEGALYLSSAAWKDSCAASGNVRRRAAAKTMRNACGCMAVASKAQRRFTKRVQL